MGAWGVGAVGLEAKVLAAMLVWGATSNRAHEGLNPINSIHNSNPSGGKRFDSEAMVWSWPSMHQPETPRQEWIAGDQVGRGSQQLRPSADSETLYIARWAIGLSLARPPC